MPIFVSLILAGSAALALSAIFSIIQDKWPETYTTVSSVATAFYRLWLPSHLLMRLVPVVIVGYLLGAFLKLWGGYLWLGTLVAILGHLGLTNFRAIQRIIVTGIPGRKIWFIVYHLVVVMLVVFCARLAAGVGYMFPALAVSPAELLLAVWTAIAVTVVSYGSRTALARLTHLRSPYEWARMTVGEDFLKEADVVSIQHGADPILIRSIILGEALQRPKWVRTAERFVGRWKKLGTYGIAQVQGESSTTDEESVAALVREIGPFDDHLTEQGEVRFERLRAFVEKRTPDPEFSQLVAELYREQRASMHASAGPNAPDRLPVLRRERANRKGQRWEVCGDVWINSSRDRLVCRGGKVSYSPSPSRRCTFVVSADIGLDRIGLDVTDAEGKGLASLDVDLRML